MGKCLQQQDANLHRKSWHQEPTTFVASRSGPTRSEIEDNSEDGDDEDEEDESFRMSSPSDSQDAPRRRRIVKSAKRKLNSFKRIITKGKVKVRENVDIMQQGARVRRPAMDFYAIRFTILLLCLSMLVFTWGVMSGETRGFVESLTANNFSGSQVMVVISFMALICIDRTLYTWYRYDQWDSDKANPMRPRSMTENSDGATDTTFTGTEPGSDGQWVVDEHPNQTSYRPLARVLQQVMLVAQLVLLHVFYIYKWYIEVLLINSGQSQASSSRSSMLTTDAMALSAFYILCLTYIVLTSLQLKYDIHVLRGGLRFTHTTNFFPRLGFYIYTGMPFLPELRVILDWINTQTSLNLFMWMKIEDAHLSLYRTRIDMEWRAETPPGQSQPLIEKVYMGGALLLLLLALLVGPIIFFSSMNRIWFQYNEILTSDTWITASLKVQRPGILDHHSTLSTETLLFRSVLPAVSSPRHVGDVFLQRIRFPDASDSWWMLTQRTRTQIAESLTQKDAQVSIVLSYQFNRGHTMPKSVGSDKALLDPANAKKLMMALSCSNCTTRNGTLIELEIKHIYYPYLLMGTGDQVIRRTGDGLDVNHPVQNINPSKDNSSGKSIFLSLEFEDGDQLPHWFLYQKDHDMIGQVPYKGLSFSVTGEKTVGDAGLSVNVLYSFVIVTVGNMLRLFFKDSSKKIIWEEVPDTDLLMDLINGVYIARIQGMLDIEWILYHEFLRIYRSPELMQYISKARTITGEREPLVRSQGRASASSDAFSRLPTNQFGRERSRRESSSSSQAASFRPEVQSPTRPASGVSRELTVERLRSARSAAPAAGEATQVDTAVSHSSDPPRMDRARSGKRVTIRDPQEQERACDSRSSKD